MLIALFLMGYASAPQTKEQTAMSANLPQTYSKPLCLDLRPWQMLPCQKMAKELEGRVVAAHAGCCVFCVLCLVLCLRGLLATGVVED